MLFAGSKRVTWSNNILLRIKKNRGEDFTGVVTVCKEYKDDPAFYDDANPGVRIDYAPRRASTPVQNLLKKWANARTRRRPQLRRHKSLRRSSTHHASRGV